jgi:hypothetical protein
LHDDDDGDSEKAKLALLGEAAIPNSIGKGSPPAAFRLGRLGTGTGCVNDVGGEDESAVLAGNMLTRDLLGWLLNV